MIEHYSDTVQQHLRLCILRELEGCADYKTNESILGDQMRAFGFSPTRDSLRTTIGWLAEQGLAKKENYQGIWVVTLTPHGLDVAQGAKSVDGVRRPAPKG